MYSILLKTQTIADKLQAILNTITIRWKDSESTQSYHEEKPKVYAFTYDDLTGDFPLDTPSCLVQVLSIQNDIAEFCIYCCVCNPALQDKEITIPVQGNENVYQYKTSENIDSKCIRSELYRACLMLGEQVYLAVNQMSNDDESISGVALNTPDPYMAEFPYCECTITFNLALSYTKIKSQLWEML